MAEQRNFAGRLGPVQGADQLFPAEIRKDGECPGFRYEY